MPENKKTEAGTEKDGYSESALVNKGLSLSNQRSKNGTNSI